MLLLGSLLFRGVGRRCYFRNFAPGMAFKNSRVWLIGPLIGGKLGSYFDKVAILTGLVQVLLVSILAIDVLSHETISLNYE